MVQTNQRGSILGFVVIGGVLALLLVGGAYFVRHTLVPVDEPVVSQNDSDDSTQSLDDETNASETDDEQTDEEVTLPGQTDDNAQPQSTQENLPQTGPADVLLSGALLSGLVAAGTAYKRSRALTTSL